MRASECVRLGGQTTECLAYLLERGLSGWLVGTQQRQLHTWHGPAEGFAVSDKQRVNTRLLTIHPVADQAPTRRRGVARVWRTSFIQFPR